MSALKHTPWLQLHSHVIVIDLDDVTEDRLDEVRILSGTQ